MPRIGTNVLGLLALAALALACDPGDDLGPAVDGGSGGDISADFSFSDRGSSSDAPASGNLACHLNFEDGGEACVSCLVDRCGDELEDLFGVPRIPTDPGGRCEGFLSCLDACPCEDDDCGRTCEQNMSAACEEGLETGMACQASQCGPECSEDDPPDPTGDYCTEAVATLSAESGVVEGDLSSADRLGGPRGDAYFDVYAVSLPMSGSLTVGMAGEIDTYLYAMSGDCGTLSSDDDGGGGTNSQLTLPAGTAFVIATTFSGSETGAYALTVTAD